MILILVLNPKSALPNPKSKNWVLRRFFSPKRFCLEKNKCIVTPPAIEKFVDFVAIIIQTQKGVTENEKNQIIGSVIYIDNYGNIPTKIKR